MILSCLLDVDIRHIISYLLDAGKLTVDFLGLLQASGVMPRNTSVDDFMALVEAGDIPPPESNVLSTPLCSQKAHKTNRPQQVPYATASTVYGGYGAPAPATFTGNEELPFTGDGSNARFQWRW